MNPIQEAERWIEGEKPYMSEVSKKLLSRITELETDKTELIELLEVRNNQEDYAEVWAERNALLVRADQILADSRQLAEAVIEAHGDEAYIDGYVWKSRPHQCPACQTARRVLEGE